MCTRQMKIIIGLILVGFAIYSANSWFYLGVIPLTLGVLNICPRKIWSSYFSQEECCEGDTCCAPTTADDKSVCCTPATEVKPKNIGGWSAAKSSTMPLKDENGNTIIYILGTGCKKCKTLEEKAKEALLSLDGEYDVQKIEDIQTISAYGVVSTPALVVNDKVLSTGKVLSVDEITTLLNK